MKVKKKLRAARVALAKKIQRRKHQNNPLDWYVNKWKGPATDLKWSELGIYENHNWDGTKDPFFQMFDSLSKWQSVAIESGTGTGKTYMLPRVIYWFLDNFDNSLVVTTAPKQSQLKSILWSEMAACFRRFKKLRPKAEMFSLRVLPEGTNIKFGSKFNKTFQLEDLEDEDYSELHQCIGVVSGVRADEESATKMQGFHRKYMLFVVEECPGVPDPVLTAIKQTCSGDYNIILAVGNPDSQLDALHQFTELSHVDSIRVSAYDHPNIVNGETIIHGAVTQKSIDIRADELGTDSPLYQSRIRGIAPKQAKDSLIKYDWIVSCMKGRPEFDESIQIDQERYNAVGVDVANSNNGDLAALCWGKKNVITWIHEFRCPNANDLADNLTKDTETLNQEKKQDYQTGKVQDYNINDENIGVDAVGVGVGTVNQFETLGWNVTPLQGFANKDAIPQDNEGKHLYNFESLRSQMYFQAAQDLMKREVIIDLQDKSVEKALIKELTIIQYSLSKNSIKIESKDNIKKKLGGKSPNLADAFVYWNWVSKDRTGNNAEAPFIFGSSHVESGIDKKMDEIKKGDADLDDLINLPFR